jgi:hypothetical protein
MNLWMLRTTPYTCMMSLTGVNQPKICRSSADREGEDPNISEERDHWSHWIIMTKAERKTFQLIIFSLNLKAQGDDSWHYGQDVTEYLHRVTFSVGHLNFPAKTETPFLETPVLSGGGLTRAAATSARCAPWEARHGPAEWTFAAKGGAPKSMKQMEFGRRCCQKPKDKPGFGTTLGGRRPGWAPSNPS